MMTTSQRDRFSGHISGFLARGQGLRQRGVALLLAGLFGMQAVGCGAEGPASGGASFGEQVEESPESSYAERLVRLELSGSAADPDTGEQSSGSFGADEFELGDYHWHSRELIVDGKPTQDLFEMLSGTETVVPLRDGGFMTIRRTGDVLDVIEIDSPTMPADAALPPRLRIAGSSIEVLGESEGEKLLLDVSGIEDLPDVERELTLSLGLDLLLASAEQSDQILPAVILAAVIRVAGRRALFCSAGTLACAAICGEDFEIKCAPLRITVRWPSIDVGFALSNSCRCL